MAKDKRTIGVDVSEEVVNAFEAGIVFGRMVEVRRQELLDMWKKLYRRAAPVGIRRELMVPCLAYKIQQNAYGTLKPDFVFRYF